LRTRRASYQARDNSAERGNKIPWNFFDSYSSYYQLLVEPGTNYWPIFMQRFYGKILWHGSKAISVGQAGPKHTRTELNQARRRWQDAGACLVTVPIIKTLASAVRRRGSRASMAPNCSKTPFDWAPEVRNDFANSLVLR
jgi:hypothetical protein